MSKKISESDKKFVAEWMRNGNQASLAYKVVNPEVTNGSAAVMATRALNKPEVIEYIEVLTAKIRKAEAIELSWVVTELKNIVYDVNNQKYYKKPDGRYLERPDYKAQLGALAQLSKIAGFETRKVDMNVSGSLEHKAIKVNFKKPDDDENKDE